MHLLWGREYSINFMDQNLLVLLVVNVMGSLGSLLSGVFSATTVTEYVVNGLSMFLAVYPTTTLNPEVTTDTVCESP